MNFHEIFKVYTQKHTEFVYIFKNNMGLFLLIKICTIQIFLCQSFMIWMEGTVWS
jgi:hypothetical protein